MSQPTVKIAVVGHVDHGKSTLIGRLLLATHSLPKEKMAEIRRISKELGKDTELAYLADYLREERENEMTIDTTQTFLKTGKRNYVFIDTPGHVEFIRNMLTGATQAEAAVFLIDINSGIQEQTRRHAYIVGMLGISAVIGVFNKMDLAGYQQERFEGMQLEFLKLMADLGIKPHAVIPVSAKDGANISRRSREMNWYKGPSLLKALDTLKCGAKSAGKPLRFPIQDVYENDGEKIIAGKVASGMVTQGCTVTLFPSLRETRVNSIKIFPKQVKKASAGESIGLVLDDPAYAKRGEIIAQEDAPPKPTRQFKGLIFWISAQPLALNKPVTLRCATQEVNAFAEKIEKRIDTSTLEILEENASLLKINEAGVVIFQTEKPIIVENFAFLEELGRFIIESNDDLEGAGIVTTD